MRRGRRRRMRRRRWWGWGYTSDGREL